MQAALRRPPLSLLQLRQLGASLLPGANLLLLQLRQVGCQRAPEAVLVLLLVASPLADAVAPALPSPLAEAVAPALPFVGVLLQAALGRLR